MTRTGALLTITLASLLATPIVVQATSMPKQDAARPDAAPAWTDVTTTSAAAEPVTCARKVRVVYAANGESRTGCAAPVTSR